MVGGLVKMMIDKAIIIGVSAAAGTALIETGVGAAAGYGIATWQAIELVKKVNDAALKIQTGGTAILGFFSFIKTLAEQGGDLSKVPLPDQPYRSLVPRNLNHNQSGSSSTSPKATRASPSCSTPASPGSVTASPATTFKRWPATSSPATPTFDRSPPPTPTAECSSTTTTASETGNRTSTQRNANARPTKHPTSPQT
jgi:hypothetical protein